MGRGANTALLGRQQQQEFTSRLLEENSGRLRAVPALSYRLRYDSASGSSMLLPIRSSP